MAAALDEELYSRQLLSLNLDTMRRLVEMEVLVVGLRGVGVETAKNAILLGPKSVTLVDSNLVELEDLGTNFFLSEQDIGKKRSDSCLPALQALNPYVEVEGAEECCLRDKEFLQGFDCAIFTLGTHQELREYNKICREGQTKFITSLVNGVAGTLFNDFGDSFVVNDADGRDPIVQVFEDFRVENGEGIVYTKDTHRLFTGMTVRIIGAHQELNEKQFSVVRKDPKTFSIGVVSPSLTFSGRGSCKQIKTPIKLHHLSLEESSHNPGELSRDETNIDLENQIHIGLLSVWKFQDNHGGALPRSRSDVNECLEHAKQLTLDSHFIDCVEENVIRDMARLSGLELAPLTCLMGAIAAQEMVKCTGKFQPVSQWAHFGAFELLSQQKDACGIHVSEKASRYLDQIKIFGEEFQKKLENTNFFLVGAGALGCEFLKNFSLMGIGCGPKGSLHVTDMDSVAPSNLNRQFLFHQQHINKSKSEVAAAAALKINPTMNLHCHTKELGLRETEKTFDQRFWGELSGAVNASDNIECRNYISNQCVLHEKSYFESATHGLAGKTQMILPHETAPYHGVRPQQAVAEACTLKQHPYRMEHCVQLAEEHFYTRFGQTAQSVNKYLKNRDIFMAELIGKEGFYREAADICDVINIIQSGYSTENMIKCALGDFGREFYEHVVQLIKIHPKDSVDKGGKPFWKGHRIFPSSAKFDQTSSLHMCYIRSYIEMLSEMLGLGGGLGGGNIDLDEISMFNDDMSCPVDILRSVDVTEMKRDQCVVPKFDKDRESHQNFMFSYANLMATNYKIENVPKLQCLKLSQKIVPAIVTTTAAVTAFVSLEIYKHVLGLPADDYRNMTCNLGTNWIMKFSYPETIRKTDSDCNDYSDEFTIWDKVTVNARTSLQSLVEDLKSRGAEPISIQKYELTEEDIEKSNQKPQLYSRGKVKRKQERFVQNLSKSLLQLYSDVYKIEIPDDASFFTLKADYEAANAPRAIKCLI